MGLPVPATARTTCLPSRTAARVRSIVALSCAALLAACAYSPQYDRKASDLPPLQLSANSHTIAVTDVEFATPDLLAVDDAMREFVQRYTQGMGNQRLRLKTLHRAIKGSGALGVEYDPFAEGSAIEAFHRGSANCLSYANLFIALAREAELDASYQWLEVKPQWTRMGERVAVRLHVNVVVRLPRHEQFMVDIDPLPTRDIAGSREISDTDAQALYHNNLAMAALADGDLEQAWLHEVRALQLSPQLSQLWVNMGAIYRHAGQLREAEADYLYALELDPLDRSAMNNLMVLYRLEQREEAYQYWLARVENYRDDNPYYHAWLGDQAAQSEDWRVALGHYLEAVNLMPEDADLLYTTGLIYTRLDESRAAQRYIGRALDAATLHSQRQRYQALLDELSQQQLVGG